MSRCGVSAERMSGKDNLSISEASGAAEVWADMQSAAGIGLTVLGAACHIGTLWRQRPLCISSAMGMVAA